MRQLPSGTVTFLFTDVEGSTRLLHELGGQAYATLLHGHRRVLREAFARHGGVEVDTQGDAFFVAFPTAPGALEAAREVTEALGAGRIRVRVGLHTGTPLLTEDGYVGADVHRAARIMAAGHGGQVLVSAETAALVERDGLHDLGEHRFKDLAAAERIYQLGEEEFPPLKSLYRVTLPVTQTAFLGRERELGDVAQLLGADVRLLTLTGPGGTGKTRLALQAAAAAWEHFPDGVFWVGLATLPEASLALPTLAQVLGVQEQADRSLLDVLVERVGGKRLLVVLDNAEHLLPALATEVMGLRAAVPTLALLVTSRERLQLQGERLYGVPALAEQEAVQLFLERAAALGMPVGRSDGLAELCRRLDYLPLAVELAAARSVVFSVEQLVDRLSQRLDLFKAGRDVDPRQQTLRATIEWPYDLLDEPEKQLFRRMSVFISGCIYEAAQQVADADPDTLQSLLDKSLLRRRNEQGEPRYWMLETIRDYAWEELHGFEEFAETRRRYGEYFIALAEEAEVELRGPSQRGWIDRLDGELGNLRAAYAYFVESDESEEALRLLAASEELWYARWPEEGARRFREALSMGSGAMTTGRAKALLAGSSLVLRHDVDEASAWLEEATRHFRAIGDRERLAVSLALLASWKLDSDKETARRLANEAEANLADGIEAWARARVLNKIGVTAGALGDEEKALNALEESLAAWRILGNQDRVAATLNNLGFTTITVDPKRARVLLEESLEIARSQGADSETSYTLGSLAVLETLEAAFDRAAMCLLESIPVIATRGDRLNGAEALLISAAVAAGHGDPNRAALLYDLADATCKEVGMGWWEAEEAIIQRYIAPAQASLDRESLQRAAAHAAAMSFDDALTYALQGLSEAVKNAAVQ